MQKEVTKKVFIIAIIFLFGIFSLTILAQDKKDALNSKLDQLKGKVEKLTVKVDGKDVVFEGKDAEDLAKKLRAFGKMPGMVWLSEEDGEFEGNDGNVMIYKFRNKDDKMDWTAKSDENKKIEVKIEDGKKKVTVTTFKDGKEEIKTYEGEEAEKFLQENEKAGKVRVMINKDGDEDNHIMFFNRKFDDDDNCCCGKRMKIRHFSPGKGKKIIIEKIEKDVKEKESK
ncbi:MAG: hypothetical protein RDU14_06680 [Melioribacteraceae bacterium]|nr:hypothetical protein [Melioribacteraceae bacterium]